MHGRLDQVSGGDAPVPRPQRRLRDLRPPSRTVGLSHACRHTVRLRLGRSASVLSMGSVTS